MSIPPGSRLAPYEIVSPIGAGGMGEVFLARDTRLERRVALKILPRPFAVDDEPRRFTREAQAASAINHPNRRRDLRRRRKRRRPLGPW